MARQLSLVDVHCHVHGADFDDDRGEVLRRAAAAGVTHVLAMGEGLADNQRVLAVAAEWESSTGSAGCDAARPGAAGDPGAPCGTGPALNGSQPQPRLLPCLGLHPERVASEPLEPVLAQIRAHAGRIAAIGEVGLDYWVAKEEAEREQQRRALTVLARLAIELDLPLSVHSRSAGHHALALLGEVGARRVCMHAFDGAAKHAARAADQLGYLFSVPPSVVRSPQKQKLVQRLELASLLLETDAPVLGPDREQRNEPANVVLAAQHVAQAKGLALEEVSRQTAQSAARLFGPGLLGPLRG